MNRRGFIAFLISAPITNALPWAKIASLAPTPIADAINRTLTEIIAETIRARSGEIAANVTANNALLRRLKSKGVVKPFGGGIKIED